jgi:tRNA threonylcarbamoyladenosine biosynthesis protein TsaB
MILAIDTSTRHAGIALADDQHVISSKLWYSQANHTAELLPAIAQELSAQGLAAADLDGLAVALGPGGFSSLRVGLSTAKGLAMTSRRPLAGIATLDLEAYPYLESGLPVLALLEAGRSEFASAHFDGEGMRCREDIIGPLTDLLPEIDRPTIFCGEGLRSCSGEIKERLRTLAIVVGHSGVSRLWSLVDLGRKKLTNGQADDLATLQPNYLRMPSIGGPKRRDRVPQHS